MTDRTGSALQQDSEPWKPLHKALPEMQTVAFEAQPQPGSVKLAELWLRCQGLQAECDHLRAAGPGGAALQQQLAAKELQCQQLQESLEAVRPGMVTELQARMAALQQQLAGKELQCQQLQTAAAPCRTAELQAQLGCLRQQLDAERALSQHLGTQSEDASRTSGAAAAAGKPVAAAGSTAEVEQGLQEATATAQQAEGRMEPACTAGHHASLQAEPSAQLEANKQVQAENEQLRQEQALAAVQEPLAQEHSGAAPCSSSAVSMAGMQPADEALPTCNSAAEGPSRAQAAVEHSPSPEPVVGHASSVVEGLQAAAADSRRQVAAAQAAEMKAATAAAELLRQVECLQQKLAEKDLALAGMGSQLQVCPLHSTHPRPPACHSRKHCQLWGQPQEIACLGNGCSRQAENVWQCASRYQKAARVQVALGIRKIMQNETTLQAAEEREAAASADASDWQQALSDAEVRMHAVQQELHDRCAERAEVHVQLQQMAAEVRGPAEYNLHVQLQQMAAEVRGPVEYNLLQTRPVAGSPSLPSFLLTNGMYVQTLHGAALL